MIWNDVQYLWLLLVMPFLMVLFFYQRKRAGKIVGKQFDSELIQKLRFGYSSSKQRWRNVFLSLSMILIVVSLAGPKIGTEVREVERRGLNMLIALDLSRSMNAEDISPSRLQKAKFEINRLIDRLQGDRVGLIVFTGEAFVQSPMTRDYAALRLFLDIAETEQMPNSTTNLNAALTRAGEVFESVKEANAESGEWDAADVLLVIADGEHFGEDPIPAVRELQEKGVKVFSLGIGTERGGRIPVYEEGQLKGYFRSENGETVITRMSSERLRAIAFEGGGSYFEIRSGNETIDPLLARLEDLERNEFATQEFTDYKNRYQTLLMAGLLLFILTIFLKDD